MTLTRQMLTAPHMLAYSFALKHVHAGDEVLDFGCRHSLLPRELASIGMRVSVTDRDRSAKAYQKKLADQLGVSVEWIDELPCQPVFDVVVACWALQHNDQETIGRLVRDVCASLKYAGSFVYVGSWTPGSTFWQANRPDPQWVLGAPEFQSLVVNNFAGKSIDMSWFWYNHGTIEGEYCDPSVASAVCACFRKCGTENGGAA